MRDYSETRLQVAVVDYLNGEIRNGKNVLKVQRPFNCLFLHPVNEFRDKTEAFWAIRKGILKGAADLLFWWGGGKGAIELKTTSSLREDQKKFKQDFIASNGYWALCRTVAEVRDTLISWGLECKNMQCIEPRLSQKQLKDRYYEFQRPQP